MIRLRQTIERGMRHRWLGPLFVVIFCLMLALLFMHAVHDGHDMGTELSQFCLGLTIMFGLMVLIRLRWRVVVPLVVVRPGRAPPLARFLALPVCGVILAVPPPLRL
jgi:hypothetical protein